MQNQERSLQERFRAGVRRFAQHKAIMFAGRTLDFAETDNLSDRVAAALAARGIRKGDRLGLYCINSDWFVLAYLGIIKAGAVVVPINLLLNPKETAFILNDAGARALIYHETFDGAVAVVRGLVKTLEFCVRIGTTPQPGADLPWADMSASPAVAPMPEINPATDLAVILYTSGTTGHPKGAMLTHGNLLANTDSIGQALQVVPGAERFLVVLPFFHAFAATACMLMPLFSGSMIVALPRFDPAQTVEMIATTRSTIFMGVPSMFIALLHLSDAHMASLASLKYCISGGAALPVAVKEQFEKRTGKIIYEGDGPTECSPCTCVNPIGGRTKPGTIGLPLPGVEMCILSEHGEPVADGVIGELCVRGRNVMKGYWNMPAETKEAFFGDWFRTGDLGARDDDGYFSILDRRKDMIIVNGMNIYPRVVEEVLIRCAGVREVAVIGEPHALHGEIPVAYVSLRDDAQTTGAKLRAECLASLGRHEAPRKFYFLPELPKNAAGKIMKRQLRKQGEHERGIRPD